MLSAGVRLEKLKFYLSFNVIFAEVSGSNLDLVPLEHSLFGPLDL